jgi:hypothetical protein
METEHNISASILDEQLTIVQGSVKDLAPVKETIAPSNKPASIIISGIGSTPEFSLSLHPVKMVDPYICEEGLTVVLSAIRELRRENVIAADAKPLICTVSTTGISKTRDVPYVLAPLYHVVLATAHKDKAKAEALIAKASMETGNEAPLSGFVILRPTLLGSGPAKGLENVKTGWERHPNALEAGAEKGTKPAMGTSISRADVGLFIFEEVIKGGQKWAGKCVSMTY